jgi:hypothetical protein
MTITLVELFDKLKSIDEVTLMERLEITSEDLVDKFDDRIEDQFDSLSEEFNIEEDNE